MAFRRLVLAGGGAAALTVLLSGCLWTSLGHDLSNSRRQELETRLGPANVAGLAESWRVDGLTGVTGTPAVRDNVVYVGTWAGEARAFELGTGRPVWQRQVAAAGTMIDDSPLVTEDRVYLGDARGRLHALDRATGAEVWNVALDTHANTRIFSSPVLAPAPPSGGGDVLVIGVASTELALIKPDYTFRGSVVGLDPATGALRWRLPVSAGTDGAGMSVWSSAAIDPARGLAYIGTGQAYEAPAGALSDSLLAIRYGTGELAWSRQFTANDVYTIFAPPPRGPDADIGAAPNLFRAGGRDLVGVGDKAGIYATFDRATGETVWARQLTPGSALGGVMVVAAYDRTAGANGVIYVTSNTMNPAALASPPDPSHRSTTFALDAATGAILWQREMPGATFGALAVANGVVYQPTVPGVLYALDGVDGDVLWSAEPGGDMGAGVSIASGHVLAPHGFWFLTAPPSPLGGVVSYTPGGA
jgi:polyvinyl alcohol dehydrogenase (cytochrome)